MREPRPRIRANERAAGAEDAAARRIDGARNFALQQARLVPGGRIRNRDGGEESSAIGVAGPAGEALRGRDLYDTAQIHDRDSIGDVFDHREIVGDEQHGQTEIPGQPQH